MQVLDSGTLALSSGPVRNARGEVFATFTSIWRREAPGVWRIILTRATTFARSVQPPTRRPDQRQLGRIALTKEAARCVHRLLMRIKAVSSAL